MKSTSRREERQKSESGANISSSSRSSRAKRIQPVNRGQLNSRPARKRRRTVFFFDDLIILTRPYTTLLYCSRAKKKKKRHRAIYESVFAYITTPFVSPSFYWTLLLVKLYINPRNMPGCLTIQSGTAHNSAKTGKKKQKKKAKSVLRVGYHLLSITNSFLNLPSRARRFIKSDRENEFNLVDP